MSPDHSSSVRSRRVSGELRRYRELAGLTGMQAASALGMSPSKISRIETGNRGLREDDVLALLTLYRVPQRRRDELLDLVRRTGDEPASLLGRTGILPKSWKNLARLESRAIALHTFEPLLLPELTQIPEYAAAVITGLQPGSNTHSGPDLSTGEIDQLVAARVGRQVRLRHHDVRYLAVLDEMVLRRQIGGPATMRRQLRHLADLAERPNITVLIRPFASPPHRGLAGPFTLLDFAEEPGVALVTGQTGPSWIDDPDELTAIHRVLADVITGALDETASAELIARLAEDPSAG